MTRKKLVYLIIGGAILAGLILWSSVGSQSSDIAQAARAIGSCCGF